MSAEMTISERYGQLYLLTSPHTNTIGCYALVPRIAAAEAGLSTEELKNVLDRLEEKGVALYRVGFVLVRTWFRHSTWESTFTGNVAKAAAREAAAIPEALKSPWIEACVEAGVPADVVEGVLKKPVASPSKGASKGLADNNGNPTGLSTKPTTTPQPGECNEPSGGGDQVYLLPIAEIHRVAVEALRHEYGLNAIQLQEIGYELSQRMEDETSGRGKPINRVHSWLGKLAKAAASGERVLDRGAGLAGRHAEALRRARGAAREQESERLAAAAADAQRTNVVQLLAELSEQELSALADLAFALCDNTCTPKKTRDSIRDAVLGRKLLSGLGGVAITKAALQWIAQGAERS